MPRATVNVRVKGPFRLEPYEDSLRKRRRGEILHLALSFVKTREDLPRLGTFVKRALVLLGEKYAAWNLKEDLIRPLEEVLSHDEAELFFSPAAKEIFCERSIIPPAREGKREVFRPDRMVLFEDRVVVVDFKSEEPAPSLLEDYRAQVKNYAGLARELFGLPAEGYLLFLAGPRVEKVFGG